MAGLPSPEEVWARLTDVERTALQVLVLRTREGKAATDPATGKPLFVDPYGELVLSRCVPEAQQQETMAMSHVGDRPSAWVAVRTAEIDRQTRLAVMQGSIRQVVIVGAGMDTRAWRLEWPEGTRLFEVDTPSMLSFKAQALEGCQPACARAELALDLRESERLGPMLQEAGYDKASPTYWLMEGFIGYLSKEAGAAVFSLLHSLSAPGSVLVLTAPPTSEHRDATAAKGVKLHHTTFEPATDTLARARACGWQGELVSAEEQQQRYGVQGGLVQVLLVLHKE